ncbi:PAS domain S-box protein [Cytobacillus sp. FJAT-54145]|uniref:histidine kinase n=1 Tax=Cytobacillus spartinae TaxID=3299023 RepID=A0ABW6KL83_9BACI
MKPTIDSDHKKNCKDEINREYKLSNIFSSISDGIIIFDQNGIIIDVNDSICEVLGIDRYDLIQSNLESHIPKDRQYKVKKIMEILSRKNEAKGNLPLLNGDNTLYFDLIANKLIDSNLYITILRNVTEKNVLEQKVKKNSELYKDLFVEALDAIVFWDNDGQVIDANDSACKIFECHLDELKTRKLDEFVPLKDEKYYKIVNTLKSTGSVRDQLLFLMPNGQNKILEFTSKLNAVDGNNIIILRNVTERYRMEEELRHSERKFRNIFEGALEGILLWNDKSEIIDINESGLRMLELSKNDIVGKSFFNFLKYSNVVEDEIYAKRKVLLENGQIKGILPLRLESGNVKYFEFSSKHNVLLNISLTVFKDITDKLNMEEQLRKSDTLNVIGQLAAGIAHEIRNPMTALKGFIQLLEDSFKEEHSMYFSVITTELNRIDSIINEFLILAKPQAVMFVEKDVAKIMQETVDLLSAQAVLHNVQFNMVLGNEIPSIYCEPNQLKKVFINIIKNAIEVMPTGGIITIIMKETDDHKVHISIRDEGSGIPDEKLKRLGEPFYTTKERGTGLGLMVTYKIVEEHEGNIQVESELGVGTTFNIYLPLKKGNK